MSSARQLVRIWNSIADRGRDILLKRQSQNPPGIRRLCRDLLSEKGEASGAAIARDLVEAYEAMSEAEKLDFFELLAEEFSPEVEAVVHAAEAYRDQPNADTLIAVMQAVEPPRQELIRRINLAPRGTASIVAMRERLLQFLPDHPELRAVDADMRHLLRSWFNRGFLVMSQINWSTPAAILEKLFEYEAVHAIRGWPDMRRRLEEDRRCFAFFHPALPDEPLIFVEVALIKGVARSIGPLLDCAVPPHDVSDADTALFYSINSCQSGLRGISFGSFLIKQVVSDLLVTQPQLKTFVTLSPVPGFRSWLDTYLRSVELDTTWNDRFAMLDRESWYQNSELAEALKEPLLLLCARFLVARGDPTDPVAAFHLGNGASIDRINWLADTSDERMRQSAGIMVNYLYRIPRIEKNHEQYVNNGTIATSGVVKGQFKKSTESASWERSASLVSVG